MSLPAALALTIVVASATDDFDAVRSFADAEPARPTGQLVPLKTLRRSTPEERERWEQAAEAIWRTPLGEIYQEYLFSPIEDHSDLPLWARQLTERLFREPHHLRTRASALQIMAEDLFVREKMNADVIRRVVILNSHVDQREANFKHSAEMRSSLYYTPVVVAAVAYGSPAVRRELRMYARAGYRRARGLTVRRHPRPSRMLTEFGRGYDWVQSANFLGYALIGANAADYAVNEIYWSLPLAPADPLLGGLEDMIRAMEPTDGFPKIK